MTNSANPTLQQLLAEKLRPHADRVLAGNPNDFDFLPAALHHANAHAASALTQLGEQSAETREHFTQMIHKLMLDQSTSFESITANLSQSDAGVQQRVSDLALKTRENLAVLLRTLQSDQEKQLERYVALNRRTNMLLYSCLGVGAVTVVLLVFLLLKR